MKFDIRTPRVVLSAALLLTFSVFLCPPVRAQSGANAFTDSFMPGDELVETIRFGFSRAGLASPFTSFPVGIRQCAAAVEELRRNPSADPATIQRLDELLASFPTGVVEASADLSYRMYLRSSEELIENYEDTSGIDLYRLYLSEPPPVRINLGYAGTSGLSVRAESVLRREYDSGDPFKFDNFWVLGDSDNPLAIENHDFVRGYIAWSSGDVRVLFGRDKVHFGPETYSSLLVSDRLPYWDSLRANVPLGPIRMDWYIATIPALNVVGTSESLTPGTGYGYVTDSTSVSNDTPTIIIDALHRFEWRSGTFRAAVAGNVTYVRPNNYFEISDFFPIISWHSTDVMPNNLRLIADFSWTFLPGWTLSGQAGYDDISATIVGVGDNGVPTIDAYILGLRWDGGTVGARKSAQLEFGYTHYLWGSYDEVATSHDNASSGTLARAIYRFRLDSSNESLPLTSPYGPGAIWIRSGAEFPEILPGLNVSPGCLILSKNTEANLLDTVYEASDDVKNALRILYAEVSVAASYRWKSFVFYAQPLFALRDDTFWAELALGVSYGFHVKTSTTREK